MTIEQYNRATKILEEKQQLESELHNARFALNFEHNAVTEEICAKLFKLGQEFAAL